MVNWRHPLHHHIKPRAKTVTGGAKLIVQYAQLAIAAADAAAIVYFAAVGHAVAAGARGVVAPAHAARVTLGGAEQGLRNEELVCKGTK